MRVENNSSAYERSSGFEHDDVSIEDVQRPVRLELTKTWKTFRRMCTRTEDGTAYWRVGMRGLYASLRRCYTYSERSVENQCLP